MELAISIDIGGTNTKIALVDEVGTIHKKSQFLTWEGNSKNAFFELLYSNINELLPNYSLNQIKGIGIDSPSCVPQKGIIKAASNLPLKGEIPIVDILANKFNKPIFLCNDANAAALGEGKFGNARGMKDFAVITLGTGLGSGIIINGEMLTGQSGLGGELGHIIAKRDGRQCRCGKKGCLETYVSARGIRRNFLAQLAKSNQKSVLEDLPFNQITAEKIGSAAKNKDFIAIQAFEQAGKMLGENLANFVHIFEPEGIILAGGVAEVGEILFRPTIEALFENLLPNYINNVQILPSALGLNEAALLGASSMVFN